MTRKSFLVVWRTDQDEFFQTNVQFDSGLVDVNQFSTRDWVEEALKTEDLSPLQENESYELILVCDMPTTFYY